MTYSHQAKANKIKEQAKKNKPQTSKKFFAFASDFAWCEKAFKLECFNLKWS